MRQKTPAGRDDDKVRVRVRLDSDVLDHFRAKGGDWQERLNAALALEIRREKRRVKHRNTSARKAGTGAT